MSKNQPASSAVSVSSLEHVVQHKKPKRKISKVRLPTPPPDPTGQEGDDARKTTVERDEFLEYLETLQRGPHHNLTRTNSIFAPVIATEDAFDHLDKLYKLMEQMLLLRDQNAKLHRRIHDLEHLRNLQNIQKRFDETTAEVNDADTIFAETLLDTILSDTKRDPKCKHQPQFRLRQSLLRRQRNRSSSVNFEKNPIDMDNLRDSYRRSSALSGPDKKVSKWTKVKAAFKWEKASQTVSDVKSQDSGIGGMQPVNYEVTRYLRVPSTSDDHGVSPSDSGACEISTPGTISSASSNEDVFSSGRRGVREDSSDDDQSFTLDYIPNSKDEHSKSPNSKNHRTTWAKMKDIIQPKNSFKKANRLSVRSDDFRVEDCTLSDEDVFESKDSKSPLHSPNIIKLPHLESTTQFSFDFDPKIQQGEDNTFIDQTSPRPENLRKLQEEIQKNYRDLQTKLSQEFQDKMKEWERMKYSSSINATSSNAAAALSPEEQKEQAFKKKMEEWEKIKGQPKHIQLQSEEHLPLEFRKKLQEWQKIKKGVIKDDTASATSSPKKKLGEWPKWKSVSGQRTELSQLEHQNFSEDFIKKLEAWKQMKSNSCGNEEETKDVKGNKTPSPKLTRKEGSGRQSKKIKDQTDKELQWFEKELSKIERDKQRLERERQKFLEREERLTKLRRSVMGPNKQNILVQTPSGFYRFEGISRKFTQKLYEWEKAQGIGPEASTFALLSNACVPTINSPSKYEPPPRLMKSKSADSIMNSELNLTHPLLSQQPSSLSLNDMENLENECLLNDASSLPDMLRHGEHIDGDEPEAVIVEVEDVIEETAGPLEYYAEKKQIPVYQHQETFYMCEGAAKAAPTVQRSESTRAQYNYNLIEDIIDLLKLLTENESDIRIREDENEVQYDTDDTLQVVTLKSLCLLQVEISSRLIEKLIRLQEANTKVTENIVKDEGNSTTSQMAETIDSVQDLSIDLLHTAEMLHSELLNRSTMHQTNNSKQDYPIILQILQQQSSKILELRRVLSYLCAASDATVPGKKKKLQRHARVALRKSSPKEITNQEIKENPPKHTDQNDSEEDLTTQIAQGAIKKRFRYRQKGVPSRVLEESDKESLGSQRKPKKKAQKVPSLPETNANETKIVESSKKGEFDPSIKLDMDVIQKVAVPTKLNYLNATEPIPRAMTNSPVQVFVKTTRKLFTPLVTSSFATESKKGEVIETATVTSTTTFQKNKFTSSLPIKDHNEKSEEEEEITQNAVSHLPPLPASPVPQRKISKDISPNIRLMLARYNQKIQEQDIPLCKSTGSSGSSSPIWRSPVTERRVRTQTEKYQQELLKSSPLVRTRGDVQKSASLSVMNQQNQKQMENLKQTLTTKSILKSSSACALISNEKQLTPQSSPKPSRNLCLKLSIPKDTNPLSPESRSYKLQKAKEEFFNAPLCPISAPPMLKSGNSSSVKYPERNRLSQISVGSESSYDEPATNEGILIKSASVGMISIDPETYKQINPEIHGGGYVSLPRNTKKQKEGLMSNIASKFRKVKMRRSKDPNKMNTISTLCRQSLIVDINTGSQETLTAEQAEDMRKNSLTVPQESRASSSADTSPSTSRSGSWIKKPRLFKPKQ